MVGKIFITRSGYDPELGKDVKDPYLGPYPTLGACRPDIREKLTEGDHVFVVSGKVSAAPQFVMGGFQVESKITAMAAYRLFPHLRLRQLAGGQVSGNIIVNSSGRQHRLDDHNSFERRISNYLVGRKGIRISNAYEVAIGRLETLEALQEILKKKGKTPFELLGRSGATLNETQVIRMREWLEQIKHQSVELMRRSMVGSGSAA